MIEDYLAECEVHKVKYNKNTGGCPLCEAAAPKQELPPESPKERVVMMAQRAKYICTECGANTWNEKGICSKYACKKKAGLDGYGRPRKVFFLCKFCGAKTKYEDRVCTKYPCRQKGGKVGMYNGATA